MFKGEFKTARFQREIPENAIVVGGVDTDGNAVDLVVGELVKVTPAKGVLPAIVEVLSSSTAASAVEEASHIMAQSDMTLGYGHVPVEYADYRYKDTIASSIDVTELVPASTEMTFWGFYDEVESLPSSVLTVGDIAMVYDSTSAKLERYIVYDASSTQTPDLKWKKDTTAFSVALKDAVKQVAMYKIINVDDLVVVDEQ